MRIVIEFTDKTKKILDDRNFDEYEDGFSRDDAEVCADILEADSQTVILCFDGKEEIYRIFHKNKE